MLRNLKLILTKIVNKSEPVLVSLFCDPKITYKDISEFI